MKKRLLWVNGHLNAGGVEKSLVDILSHLDYNRYEVDLLLLEELGDYAPDLPPQVHVRFRCITNTCGPVARCLFRCIREHDWLALKMRLIFLLMKLFGPGKLRLARRLLTDGRHYDCAIGFRSGICTQVAAFAASADKRITWWHHGAVNVDRDGYLESAGVCDRIAVVSEACRKMLCEAFPTLEGKLMVVPNMVDCGEIGRKADAFQPYESNGLTHIVTLSRLAPEKHIQNVIFAAEKLKQAGLRFQWHVVGGGALLRELEQGAAELGVSDVVRFEGSQPNPYPYLRCAELLVHPSYTESQGLVVLEAMGLGVPCVVTKSLGPCEFMEDGANGILTEQSPESLAEKVLEILADRGLYERIKANTRCPERFEPERVMAQINELLGG